MIAVQIHRKILVNCYTIHNCMCSTHQPTLSRPPQHQLLLLVLMFASSQDKSICYWGDPLHPPSALAPGCTARELRGLRTWPPAGARWGLREWEAGVVVHWVVDERRGPELHQRRGPWRPFQVHRPKRSDACTIDECHDVVAGFCHR